MPLNLLFLLLLLLLIWSSNFHCTQFIFSAISACLSTPPSACTSIFGILQQNKLRAHVQFHIRAIRDDNQSIASHRIAIETTKNWKLETGYNNISNKLSLLLLPDTECVCQRVHTNVREVNYETVFHGFNHTHHCSNCEQLEYNFIYAHIVVESIVK